MRIPIHRSPSQNTAGSTVVETLIATAIAAVGITSLCVASGQCISISRAHRELMVADQSLQGRTEQFRAANWAQLTDTNSVATLMNTPPATGTGGLQDQRETISISAYPPVSPAVPPITATRDANGTISMGTPSPGTFSLRSATAVRIDFQETWTSAQGGRSRVRECSTIVAVGGLIH